MHALGDSLCANQDTDEDGNYAYDFEAPSSSECQNVFICCDLGGMLGAINMVAKGHVWVPGQVSSFLCRRIPMPAHSRSSITAW
jgi:hypothetical protein